ncbi:AGE family epimerase/isomerase [Spirosoma flavum]|uniref:AGE family epimerase/isomerase n=1 Tax=Spirosoma flavum TaxID=2048557 RepID=A0ABW6ANV2_9BACT
MLDFQKLSATYHQALLRQVVPFWLKNSRDERYGGYFDLLSTTGDIIEGDKFVAMQAQQVWSFAWLYNTFDGQPTWLEHARHGAVFLNKFAHADTLACYAQLDRLGHPVAPSYTSIADSITAMAYVQVHRATGEDEWAMLAKQVFSILLQRRVVVRTEQATTIGGFRHLQHLSEAVAILKMVQEIKPLLDEETWRQNVDLALQDILYEFMDRRTDTIREYVLPEGAFANTPEGRRLNVGLTFQTANYLLDFYAESASLKSGLTINNNRKLGVQVVTWCLRLCEQAWDETNAGLNQYVDLKQQPFIFPDWQQKWAWVQVEALSALIKGYVYTRNPDCLKWFKRIHDYTFQHFPDSKQPGWNLVIDQHVQPILSAKAIPTVGCFSLIRCLAETGQLLAKCGPLYQKEQSGRTGMPLNS